MFESGSGCTAADVLGKLEVTFVDSEVAIWSTAVKIDEGLTCCNDVEIAERMGPDA